MLYYRSHIQAINQALNAYLLGFMSRTPRKRLEGPGLRRDPVTNKVAVTVGELDFLESIGKHIML
jgi:hypothetical protein